MRNPTDRPERLVLGAGGAGDLRGGCARQLAGRGGWVAAPPVAAACRARPGPCRRLADRGHAGLGRGVPWAPGPRHLLAIGLGPVWTLAAENFERASCSPYPSESPSCACPSAHTLPRSRRAANGPAGLA